MIDIQQTLTTAVINAVSGLVSNIVWILLIIWGVKTLSKTIIKKIPEWISLYHNNQMKEFAIRRATNK